MNSGLVCEVGLTPERELERLAYGADYHLDYIGRMITVTEGIEDRIGKVEQQLFKGTEKWEGVSADLAQHNLGVMRRNFGRYAYLLRTVQAEIAQASRDRRSSAEDLLHTLPSGVVPQEVHDAVSRGDASVNTIFGVLNLNEITENIGDLFWSNRSGEAQKALNSMYGVVEGQSSQLKDLPPIGWESLATSTGSPTGSPATAPPPASYAPTLPPYPGGPGPVSGFGSAHTPGGAGSGPGSATDSLNDLSGSNHPKSSGGPNGSGADSGPGVGTVPAHGGGGGHTAVDSGLKGSSSMGGLGAGIAGAGLGAAGLATGAKLAGGAGFAGLGGLGGLGGAAGAGAGGAGLLGGGGLRGAASTAGAGAGASAGTAGNTTGTRGGRPGNTMMGGGGAGGANEKKKAKRGLGGYIAPKLEDEEEFGPAADISRAGTRAEDG